MRTKPLRLLTLAALLVSCAGWTPPFKGNDTGGIIAWWPEAHRFARGMAADHCAGYGKLSRIASWHARYGDYISFRCYLPKRIDPLRQMLIRR